jgi:hypothetical protein
VLCRQGQLLRVLARILRQGFACELTADYDCLQPGNDAICSRAVAFNFLSVGDFHHSIAAAVAFSYCGGATPLCRQDRWAVCGGAELTNPQAFAVMFIGSSHHLDDALPSLCLPSLFYAKTAGL